MTTYMGEDIKSMWTTNGYFLECLRCGATSVASQDDPNAAATAEARLWKAHEPKCPVKAKKS